MTEIEYETPLENASEDAPIIEAPAPEPRFAPPREEWEAAQNYVLERQLAEERADGHVHPESGLTFSQVDARAPYELADRFDAAGVKAELRADIVEHFKQNLPRTVLTFGDDARVRESLFAASIQHVTERAERDDAHKTMVKQAARLQNLDPEQVDVARTHADTDRAFKELLAQHEMLQSRLLEKERKAPDYARLTARAIDKAVSRQSPYAEREEVAMNVSAHHRRAGAIYRDNLAPDTDRPEMSDADRDYYRNGGTARDRFFGRNTKR